MWKTRRETIGRTRTHPPIGATGTAFLRSLSGANKRPATVIADQTDLREFARFRAETNCTVSSPTDATRADVSDYVAHRSDQNLGGTCRARKLAAIWE